MTRLGATRGQSLTETVVMLPIFLLAAFLLFQIGLIAMAIMYAQYGASTAARRAVKSPTARNEAMAVQALDQILVARMKTRRVNFGSPPSSFGAPSVVNDMEVNACIEVMPLPFITQVLARAFPPYQNCPPADGSGGLLYWDGSARRFIVRGSAKVRMNYR